MKLYLMLLVLVSGIAVQGQSTNAPMKVLPLTNSTPHRLADSLEAQTGGHGLPSINLSELKPNEVARGKVIFSGIAVEAVKTGRPLQLINPLAPPAYGSPDDNIVRDPTSRRTYLKIFAIKF